MPRSFALALFCACLLFAAAPSARADTVILTGGFVGGFAAGVDNPYSLNFSGAGFSAQAQGETYQSGLNNVPLTPGQTVTSSANFFLTTFGPTASATYNGVTYNGVRLGGTLTVAPVTFTVPSSADFNSEVTAPFSLAGTISFADINGALLFSVDVAGSGLATFRFDSGVGGIPGAVRVGAVTYNFAPAAVPEPGTLLLLGTGLAGAVGAVRKRRRAQA